MAEGVFVQIFITCGKLSQVDKIMQKYSVFCGITINSYVKYNKD